MKKKILVVLPDLNGGGAEKVILTLLNHFDRNAAEYFFVCINKKGPYINDVPNDIDVRDLKISGKFFFKKSFFKVQSNLLKEIKSIEPDIILSTLTEMNLTILFLKKFIKKNTTIIVRETNPPSPRWKGIKLKLMKFLYSYYYSKADKIIAISNGVKEDIKNFANLDSSKIDVIYNPLSINKIQQMSEQKVVLPNDTFNIISIGRLTPQKDFPTLIKAIKIVSGKYKVHLNILGQGKELISLQTLVKDLCLENHVTFLGFKSNPYAYLRNSDLFVLSSKWEGFGLVIVESMATGTPVIATSSNGAPREILDNGKYGKLVPVGEEKVMAESIVKFINKDVVYSEELLIDRSYSFDAKFISQQYLNLLLSN